LGHGLFGEYLGNALGNAAPTLTHHLVSQLLQWMLGIVDGRIQEIDIVANPDTRTQRRQIPAQPGNAN